MKTKNINMIKNIKNIIYSKKKKSFISTKYYVKNCFI